MSKQKDSTTAYQFDKDRKRLYSIHAGSSATLSESFTGSLFVWGQNLEAQVGNRSLFSLSNLDIPGEGGKIVNNNCGSLEEAVNTVVGL